jgi:hypothetical protein
MKTQIGLALLLLVVAAPARAQTGAPAARSVRGGVEQTDARWTPWLGCWQMFNERVRERNPAGAEAVAAAGERALGSTSDVRVCVTPGAQPNAVTLTTRVADEPVLEQTLVADGTPQSMTEASCKGTQRAEWSREGRRLFARAELSCTGQPSRTISGIATLTTDGTWLDVQAMDIEGRPSVRVRRYRRTDGPRQAGAAWTIDDVKEASGKVSPAALEAALIESGARFALGSRELVDLDEAQVPDAVIDLMVALSYPDKFQVERRAEASLDLYPPAYMDAAWSGYGGYGLGYPYFSWYPGYYGNYRYYFSPFGFGNYGLYGPYSGYYYPTSVINGGGVVDPGPQPSGSGRVVNGIGYTRVQPREAQPADGGGGRSGTASSGRATASGYRGGDSSAASSGGSSSGGGGSSSGGSGGGDGGGRTAQPR